MEYPKPLMSIAELRALGFPKEYLYQMAHKKNQNYATKTTGGGKFLFDTAKFEKARAR